jgi:hypothetical protein
MCCGNGDLISDNVQRMVAENHHTRCVNVGRTMAPCVMAPVLALYAISMGHIDEV